MKNKETTKKLERKQQQQLDDFRFAFLKNGKRKASAKQDFVVGSFSRRERSIRGKEDKKRGEAGGGAFRRERKIERENDPFPETGINSTL